MNNEKRFNEALAINDRLIERIHLMSRLMTRIMEDLEGQVYLAGELIDEYDRLAAKWADEDGEPDETKAI